MSDRSLEWERLRSRFNHDWLKNRFQSAVGSFLNSLSGKGFPIKDTLGTMPVVMGEWPGELEQLKGVLQDFERVVSPETLLELPPLINMDDATRRWLKPLIHQLWWKGRGNEKLKNAAEEAITRANEEYKRLNELLKTADAEQNIELLKQVAGKMEVEFYGLAKAINLIGCHRKLMFGGGAER